jgi:hypothetical protein
VLEEEAMLADGLISVDMVVTLPCGAKVGVEVDGPVHFFSNGPDVPTGSTLLKWRMLDRAVELGLLQRWVSVRGAGEGELEKVAQAVQAAQCA